MNRMDDRSFIPSTDEELRSAIDALKLSTQALQSRTQTLKAQNDQAKKLVDAQNGVDNRKSAHVRRVSQKRAAELQHVKFANDQLAASLRVNLRAQLDLLDRETKSVPAIVAEVLNADDRALAELDDIASSVQTKQAGAIDVNAMRDRVLKLTHALRLFRAEAVRDRLDRIYLESLSTADTSHPAANGNGTEIAALETAQDDLGSLYTEIDDMVTMAVAHEHGKPIQLALKGEGRFQMQEIQKRNQKLHARLCSLTEGLEKLARTVDGLQVQRRNLRDLERRIRQLEDSHPPKNAAKVPTPAECKDTNPAAYALLQYLGLSENIGKPSGSADFTAQLDELTVKLEQQSTEDIAQILHISDRAAARRRAVLESISDVLNTDETHDLAIQALERNIAAAKMEIEKAQQQR